MPDAFPPHHQAPALLALIEHPALSGVDGAACRGRDPDDYHPEIGRPATAVLASCWRCPSRLPCLALALRAEDPQARHGWYGGLGPVERDDLAVRLGLATAPLPETTPPSDAAQEAASLRAQGKTVNQIALVLGCSRRTAQRYLRAAA